MSHSRARLIKSFSNFFNLFVRLISGNWTAGQFGTLCSRFHGRNTCFDVDNLVFCQFTIWRPFRVFVVFFQWQWCFKLSKNQHWSVIWVKLFLFFPMTNRALSTLHHTWIFGQFSLEISLSEEWLGSVFGPWAGYEQLTLHVRHNYSCAGSRCCQVALIRCTPHSRRNRGEERLAVMAA